MIGDDDDINLESFGDEDDVPLGFRDKNHPITTKKTTYCGGPIAAGAKPAAICRLLRRVLALPLNMDLLRRDNRPAAIVLVYCGVLLRRANDPP